MNNSTFANCSNISDDLQYPEHHTLLRIIFICIHATIFIMGIAGNTAIICATMTTKALQTIQVCVFVCYTKYFQ
jgi:hypothetical protein